MLAIKMLRIMQLNCGGAYLAMAELGHTMRSNNCKIALLQEPYTVDNELRGLPSSMRVFVDSRAKAAIAIDDSNIQCVEQPIGNYGVCVRAEGSFGELMLISIYCSFSEPLDNYLQYMDRVLLLDSRIPTIYGIDANATSPLWFSKLTQQSLGYESYRRGETLEEWLITSPLFVVNEASDAYTFDGPNGVSDIDVTLVNAAAQRLNPQWAILDGHSISDHNPIVVTINGLPQQPIQGVTPRWYTRTANWVAYESQLSADAETLLPLEQFQSLTTDEKVLRITNLIVATNDRLLGRQKPLKRNISWWNTQLRQKQNEVRRCRRSYQRARSSADPSVENLKSLYRAAIRQYKDLIRTTKENDWRDFVQQHSNDPWGKVYKICRGRKKSTNFSTIKVGETLHTSWRDCSSALLNTFFPAPSMNSAVYGPDDTPEELDEFELTTGFRRIRSKAATGIDGLTGDMWRAAWYALPQYMVELYGECLNTGYFPTAWKAASVVVLLKSPEKPKTNPGSYRGICLLSVMGKILERIMADRLLEQIGGSFHQFQYGFQKRRSTDDAWLHVKQCVAESQTKYVLGVFVDFKGAFDHLEWSAILEKLQNIGCKEMTLWRSYFSGRTATTYSASTTPVTVNVNRGCPQGSICGPYIWDFMMDTLLLQLEPLCKISAYSDDLLLLVEADSRSNLERKSEDLMTLVSNWGIKAGVAVSMEKTVMMLLKGRLSLTRPPIVRYAGATVKYVTSVKYLGLTIGERVNFNIHLKSLKTKLTTTISAVKRVLKFEWGLSRQAVRIIYKGLMLACVMHGSPVWYEVASQTLGRKHIMSCQRVMLLACIPACRTVSTEALQVLAGAIPLDLEAKRRAVLYKIKREIPLAESDWSFDTDIDFNFVDISRRKTLVAGKALDDWQNRWSNSNKGRTTHQFVKEVRLVYNMQQFEFNMQLGFLLTGHGSLAEFLYRRELSGTSNCLCGAPAEDWMHVLCECPLYADARNLDDMGIVPSAMSWDVSQSLVTSSRRQHLNRFAKIAFGRRNTLLNDLNRGGSPVPSNS